MSRYMRAFKDSYFERMWKEAALWAPAILFLGIVLLLEIPLREGPFESSGLRINMNHIRSAVVFEKAFKRANLSHYDMPVFGSPGRGETVLEKYYEIDEQGRVLQSGTTKLLPVFQPNGTYGYDSMYDSFPSQLLYTFTPSMMDGKVKLDGPSDVSIPDIPKDLITQPFGKALVLKNEQRDRSIQLTSVLSKVILVLVGISTLIHGTGLYILVSIIWILKMIPTAPWNSNSVRHQLASEDICQIFDSNYKAWGLSIEFFAMSDGWYSEAGVFWVCLLALLFTVVCGLAEINFIVQECKQNTEDENAEDV